MKKSYESPKMFAETFVANQYVAACEEAFENIPVTPVYCKSDGHNQTAKNSMFTDINTSCLVKYNPGVGDVGTDGYFHTQFEACWSVVGCNRQNWLEKHPYDTNFKMHVISHDTWQGDKDGFILHDTVIDLSTAQKYQLS